MRPEMPMPLWFWSCMACLSAYSQRGLRIDHDLLARRPAAQHLNALAIKAPQAHLAKLRLSALALHVHAGHFGAAHDGLERYGPRLARRGPAGDRPPQAREHA